MAFTGPLTAVQQGYERYVDGSQLAVNLGRYLLDLAAYSSFNPGQFTIAERTTFEADIQVFWSTYYFGDIAFTQSVIESYRFEVNAPYEEPISETIEKLNNTVEELIYKLYEYEYWYQVGEGGEISEQRGQDWGQYVDNRAALFI